MSAALALAAENAATNRRSSASSASSDLNDHGMPVVPYHDAVHNENAAVAHAHHVTKPHVPPIVTMVDEGGDPDGGPHTSVAESSRVSLASETSTIESTNNALPMISLQSPKPESGGAFTFDEVMSPRHANGKRYLGGYLTHRVSMAGGFLKTWKRKYFRLRDHGILCFKQQDATTPLFEIHFQPQSLLVLDKPATTNGGGYEDAAMLAPTRGKVNASLLIILKHIEIQGHDTPASKVEVPVYLKVENESEFHAWVENIRLKMEARKRALTQDSLSAVLQGDEQQQHQQDGASTPSRDSGRQQATRNPPPRLTLQDRTASMSNVTQTMVVTPTAETRRLAANDPRSKVLFVAGPTPDPPEFTTFRSKYLLMKEIGEGSFSIVHRAVNRLTGQLCAVKCCKYSPALEEEVAILKKLSHPNLIGLEGVYQQDDMFYVVMDCMEGGDLCELLIQKQRLSESEAKMIVTQALRGLEHLHRHNILHRDLKPENILLHGDVVKIADYGLARQLPSSGSMLKRSCGTLEYAAPELLCGHAYGLKSDIFSLGVVLYVLLFGAFPFTIESASALQRMERFPEGVDVRDMSCLNRDNAMWSKVSPLAQDVLLRMLSKSEKERISAKDLLLHPWFDSTRTEPSLAVSAVDESTGCQRESGLRLQDMNVEEREQERVRDCRAKGFVELLSRGLDLTKLTKDGHTAPHVSTIVIHFSHGTISWTARGGVLGIGAGNSTRKVNDTTAGPSAKKGARVLSFSDITEIRTGHTTEAFRASNGREVPSAELCVSIVGTWRTLDLVVNAPSQRDFIVAGLQAALEKYRGTR